MKSKKLKLLFAPAFWLFVLVVFGQLTAEAQEQDKLHIVQISGLVMNQDSTRSVPGVHIYDPYRGRGTNTDYRGWFSKAFLAGDTIIISAIGYENRKFVVPDTVGDRLSIIFALKEEVTQLADVEINPFPTEEIFKEAILAMNLTQDQRTVLRNSEPDVVRELMQATPYQGSPGSNYRYIMDQQFNTYQNSAGPRANPLLNPFAWAQFINSLKRKKKKKN